MYEQEIKQARKEFRAKNYLQVLSLLSHTVGNSTTAEPIRLIAEALEGLDLKREAAEAYEQAARLSRRAEQIELQIRASLLYMQLNMRDEALLIALKLHQQIPTNLDAAYIVGALTESEEDFGLSANLGATLSKSNELKHLAVAAHLLSRGRRDETNVTVLKKIRKLAPSDPSARFSLLDFAREFCDFGMLEREEPALRRDVLRQPVELLRHDNPHSNLLWCADEGLNRLAENTKGVAPLADGHAKRRHQLHHNWSEKIRVGYISNDFWPQHATMKLLGRVLELHDRSRFDVYLFCYTPAKSLENNEEARRRWGNIVRIADMNDAAAANAIREREIDILVDLKGLTGGARTGIINSMVAPVHVAWLGFPGSAPHVDCDYIIGDHFVLPESSKNFYHEKFCRMPHSYQPNDPVHRPLPQASTRREWHLPEDKFIYASFNANRKISIVTITLWAEILNLVKNSVLWIMADTELAKKNITEKFASLGIGPKRIIFAERVEYSQHISRQQLADIALDTFPCNGHTTTSDALWAGLPVIALRGTNFASRVSESLLNAVNLPQLVTANESEYVRLATALAESPEELINIRAKLNLSRYSAPLFDAALFCKNLEYAYEKMHNSAQRGLAPEHFDV